MGGHGCHGALARSVRALRGAVEAGTIVRFEKGGGYAKGREANLLKSTSTRCQQDFPGRLAPPCLGCFLTGRKNLTRRNAAGVGDKDGFPSVRPSAACCLAVEIHFSP